MLFRKHLTINGNSIQVFQEDNDHYIIQYQIDKMPKDRRTYMSAEKLCARWRSMFLGRRL